MYLDIDLIYRTIEMKKQNLTSPSSNDKSIYSKNSVQFL